MTVMLVVASVFVLCVGHEKDGVDLLACLTGSNGVSPAGDLSYAGGTCSTTRICRSYSFI